ncbi:zeta toxin family protein [Dyadobacter linearis]|nr:zeta toxin family protein [Dyadobacter sp. CECT 9623]
MNADNIAAGLSPFNPENVAFEAGRIMLKRIKELLDSRVDFALETTLSTRSYVSTVREARSKGYSITLIYFWLASPEMAIERVAMRVRKGGHSIPNETIIRRYQRGLDNLFRLYMPICDNWLIVSNASASPSTIAIGGRDNEITVTNEDIWQQISQSQI